MGTFANARQCQGGRAMRTLEPIRVVELFPLERAALLDLLGSLDPLDWERETACPGWAVRDIAAHLVGDDLGRISRARDAYRPAQRDNEDLLSFVNSTEHRMGQGHAPAQSDGSQDPAGVRRSRDAAALRGVRSERNGWPRVLGDWRRTGAQLARPRPRAHRALASPGADPRCSRSSPAQHLLDTVAIIASRYAWIVTTVPSRALLSMLR